MKKLEIEKLGSVLTRMQSEAARRHAPVLSAEESTKESQFKILVFTMLSARTKDETTLRVVERLFQKVKTPKEILALGPNELLRQKELENLLYGIGFYRVKAKHLIETCILLDSMGFEKNVPDTLERLLELPGVGRKTANIVLARAFGRNTIGVDVHVHRISNRLGLVKTKKPEDTERALIKLIPKKYMRQLNRTFVAFGQTVCLPRHPLCSECPIKKYCPRIGVKEPK